MYRFFIIETVIVFCNIHNKSFNLIQTELLNTASPFIHFLNTLVLKLKNCSMFQESTQLMIFLNWKGSVE